MCTQGCSVNCPKPDRTENRRGSDRTGLDRGFSVRSSVLVFVLSVLGSVRSKPGWTEDRTGTEMHMRLGFLLINRTQLLQSPQTPLHFIFFSASPRPSAALLLLNLLGFQLRHLLCFSSTFYGSTFHFPSPAPRRRWPRCRSHSSVSTLSLSHSPSCCQPVLAEARVLTGGRWYRLSLSASPLQFMVDLTLSQRIRRRKIHPFCLLPFKLPASKNKVKN